MFNCYDNSDEEEKRRAKILREWDKLFYKMSNRMYLMNNEEIAELINQFESKSKELDEILGISIRKEEKKKAKGMPFHELLTELEKIKLKGKIFQKRMIEKYPEKLTKEAKYKSLTKRLDYANEKLKKDSLSEDDYLFFSQKKEKY